MQQDYELSKSVGKNWALEFRRLKVKWKTEGFWIELLSKLGQYVVAIASMAVSTLEEKQIVWTDRSSDNLVD